MNKPTSDLCMPNFAVLLAKAVALLRRHGSARFTDLESVVLGFIVASEMHPLNALGDRIVYEIDELQIPKYACLVMWLSPFGLASQHPKAALRIANFLLGVTTEQEIRALPLKLRRELGV